MSVRLVGDWKKAGVYLERLAAGVYPVATAKLYENGELVLEEMRRLIDSQGDGMWAKLSPDTIARKGHDTIYVESGYLRDNLDIRRIKGTRRGSKVFVGASPWKTHPSGLRFSDLMIFLEYGTSRIPARPLVRPSWENVQKEVKDSWKNIVREIIEEGR